VSKTYCFIFLSFCLYTFIIVYLANRSCSSFRLTITLLVTGPIKGREVATKESRATEKKALIESSGSHLVHRVEHYCFNSSISLLVVSFSVKVPGQTQGRTLFIKQPSKGEGRSLSPSLWLILNAAEILFSFWLAEHWCLERVLFYLSHYTFFGEYNVRQQFPYVCVSKSSPS
jgi:hypothetical protein